MKHKTVCYAVVGASLFKIKIAAKDYLILVGAFSWVQDFVTEYENIDKIIVREELV